MALKQQQKEPKTINDKENFERLVKQWRDETGMFSSITKKIEHHAYKKIILMGKKAIPWILEELKDRPSYWFAALHEISKQSPVPPDQLADFQMAREAWLAWGKERGLIV